MGLAGQPVVVAAADIGSNATKILVWEIAADKRPREQFQKRYALRLDDAFRAGRIEPPSVVRLIETFAEIADLCRRQAVQHLRAVATESFRSARNGREVVEAIALETGIEPEIISPQEEGRLVAEGVLLDHPERRSGFLILDIGGGSVQIIQPDRASRVRTISLPLGAVRLREMFIRSDPIAPADFKALQAHADEIAARGAESLPGERPSCAFGCGGGVRFLHAMCGILRGNLSQNQPMRSDHLDHLCQAIWPMTTDSIVRHYGIDHERAEIIVPGAVALLSLMKYLKVGELRPSSRGVRDGLLADFLKKLP